MRARLGAFDKEQVLTDRRWARFRALASAAVAAASLGLLGALWYLAAQGKGWVAGFLRSRTTLLAAGAMLGSLAGLYLIAGLMWHLGRRHRAERTSDGQIGTAAIEFALVFPIALMIVLVMIQSALLMTGNLAVHYAAYAAARSAVVWVPEKLSYEEPRNVVIDPDSSAKFHHIRSAAVFAMLPVSAGKAGAGSAVGPGGEATLQDALAQLFDMYGQAVPNWVVTMLRNKFRYAWDYTEVVLYPPADPAGYGDHEDLRVQVRHTLYLPVPYANRIFGGPLPAGSGEYGTTVSATYALTNEGVEDEIDVEQFGQPVTRDS